MKQRAGDCAEHWEWLLEQKKTTQFAFGYYSS